MKFGTFTSTVYVSDAGKKGRGVFAFQDIPAGALIERCPVVILTKSDSKKNDRTIMRAYRFAWRDGAAVALGYGSLYNHSEKHPNADWTSNYKDRYIEFRAAQDIVVDEEILIDYGEKPLDLSRRKFL